MDVNRNCASPVCISEIEFKNRLKNGQCIHCGVQTHIVKKGMLGLKTEVIPLTVSGRVEAGRCVQKTCLAAGSNVQVKLSTPVQPEKSSVNGAALAKAGATVARAGGGLAAACLGFPELAGVIWGGAASPTSPDISSDPYAYYMQQMQQIDEQQQAIQAALQPQIDPCAHYVQQMQQINEQQQVSQAVLQPQMDPYAHFMQQMQRMDEQCMQQMQQINERRMAAQAALQPQIDPYAQQMQQISEQQQTALQPQIDPYAHFMKDMLQINEQHQAALRRVNSGS